MSLVLIYHDAINMVVACDRRSVAFDVEGKATPAGDSSPKFLVLPNNLVVAATGRADVAAKLCAGTWKYVKDNPKVGFADLSKFIGGVIGMCHHFRENAQDSDELCGVLCGFDFQARHVRCVSWSRQDNFEPSENYDPALNVLAFGVVRPETARPFNDLARAMQKFGNRKTHGLIAMHMAGAIRAASRAQPTFISESGYFAAFQRDISVTLPKDFERLPKVKIEADVSLLGESRYFVGTIRTPAQGGPPTIGAGDGGTGAQFGMTFIYSMTAVQNIALTQQSNAMQGGATLVNPGAIVDGVPTTCGVMTVFGDGGENTAEERVSLPLGAIPSNYIQATLSFLVKCVTNTVPSAGSEHSSGVPPVHAQLWVELPDGTNVIVADLVGTTFVPHAGTAGVTIFAAEGNLQEVGYLLPFPVSVQAVAATVFVHTESGSDNSGEVVVNWYDTWITLQA